MTKMQERAGRGARWLDRRQPGWAGKIDIDRLSADSDSRCVIGQVFGDWGRVMQRKFLLLPCPHNTFWMVAQFVLWPPTVISLCWNVRYGFIRDDGVEEASWRRAWVAEIRRRTSVPPEGGDYKVVARHDTRPLLFDRESELV